MSFFTAVNAEKMHAEEIAERLTKSGSSALQRVFAHAHVELSEHTSRPTVLHHSLFGVIGVRCSFFKHQTKAKEY